MFLFGGTGGMESQATICKNCGSATEENYCSRCGQKTIIPHRRLGSLLSDLFGELFNLENTFFRTTGVLFSSPGSLTNAFIEGKRVRYLHPFRLFLLSIVIFIFIVSIVMPWLHSTFPSFYEVDSDFRLVETGSSSPASAPDDEGNINNADENQRFMNSLLHSIQWVLIALMPLFAMLLSIVNFRARGFYFVDNMVFAMHVHAFSFFVFSLAALFPPWRLINLLPLLVPLVYFYLAQRNVYRRGWISTGIKTLIILVIYTVLVLLSLGLTAYIQAFGLEQFQKLTG